MPAPKRMNTPHRANARPTTMFPHTVTVYNVSIETDKTTFEDKLTNHITVLRGVLLDASKAVNVRTSGLEGADAVNLYIPFSVDAVDGVTGEKKAIFHRLNFGGQKIKTGSGHWRSAAKNQMLMGIPFSSKEKLWSQIFQLELSK